MADGDGGTAGGAGAAGGQGSGSGGDGGAGAAGQGSQGGQGQQGQQQQTGSDGQPFDAARAQATIDALRASEKTAKAEAKANADAAKRLQEIEDANKSEITKAQERAEAAERKAQEAEARAQSSLDRVALAAAASKAGAHYPDLMHKSVDVSQVDRDADGLLKADGLEKLLDQTRKDYPALFRTNAGQGSADGGASGNGGAGGASEDMNARIRRAAGRGA